MQITGYSGNGQADVTVRNALKCDSISKDELLYESNLGNAYAWDSTEKDIDAGDTMLFVKNTSTSKKLYLDRAVINGSNVICTWDIGRGNATTTPSGTAVVGVSLNGSGTAASAIAYSDETAVADATVIGRVKTPITNTVVYDLRGVILNEGDYIQVNQETESTSGSVVIYGYYV